MIYRDYTTFDEALEWAETCDPADLAADVADRLTRAWSDASVRSAEMLVRVLERRLRASGLPSGLGVVVPSEDLIVPR